MKSFRVIARRGRSPTLAQARPTGTHKGVAFLRHYFLPFTFCLFLFSCRAHALIIYDNGQDETTHNTTSTGMPQGLAPMWDAVVFVSATPNTFNASAVYLGDGFFLTALHVDTPKSWQAQVAVNNVAYPVDTAFGTGGVLSVTNIPGVAGEVDLKLFRVLSPPALPPAVLNRKGGELNKQAYLIGCGLGKGAAVAEQGWLWGAESTRAKRWGMSQITWQEVYEELGSTLVSPFSTAYGADVASGAKGDSGSAMFQKIGGEWVLSGITVAVSVNDRSYYAPEPDATFYVRVADYADAILSAMTETTAGSVVIPNMWFRTYFPAMPFDAYAALPGQTAANGINTMAECYVADLNPTNAASRFTTSIAFSNDVPHIAWSPDAIPGRTYRVLGKTNLNDTCWCPTNNATHFFKVQVQME